MLAEDMADMNLDCGYAPDSDQAVQIKFMQKEIKGDILMLISITTHTILFLKTCMFKSLKTS